MSTIDNNAKYRPLRRATHGLMVIFCLAIGAAALSLGGCTCMDPNGNAAACPEF